jgi:ribosomal protein S18 acetylase RimI-like enzyme
MRPGYRAVVDHGLDRTAELASQAFADYWVPLTLSGASVLAMARQDSVDLAASRIMLDQDRPVGVALIARRGWTSRLAAMAIIPEARGQGVGGACVLHLLAEARARGERAMTLEVIEQNTGAAGLYERCGFRIVRRLVGYAGSPPIPTIAASAPALEEVDIREVAGALIAHGPPDLPWQLSGETLAQAGPPGVAYRGDAVWIALTDPSAPTVTIRTLVTAPNARRRGAASALVRAVMARHPGRQWRVPAIWPEALGALWEGVGLERERLTQWQMTTDLE